MNHKGRIAVIVGTLLVAAVPCSAMADTQSSLLGGFEAAINSCVKADAGLEREAEYYRAQLNKAASPTVRASEEYRQGYALVTAALAKYPLATVRAACLSVVHPRPDEREHEKDRDRRS
jgi:hypothetical protein